MLSKIIWNIYLSCYIQDVNVNANILHSIVDKMFYYYVDFRAKYNQVNRYKNSNQFDFTSKDLNEKNALAYHIIGFFYLLRKFNFKYAKEIVQK